jgi:hypothetical protein
MIPAKGFQSIVSPGVYAELGPLAIQLKPEFIYASNSPYELTDSFGSKSTGEYKNFYWGQSSVRLNAGAVSVGLSNENIWWGPGQYSSLMLSNNAPGFLHFTFNSRKPLKVPIGSFEWQVISGRLEDEKNIDMPIEIRHMKPYREIFGSSSLYIGDWKYLNGITFSFNPNFFKGMSLGFNRSFSGPSKSVLDPNLDISFFRKYFPIFGELFKSKVIKPEAAGWNQLATIFFKNIFPTSHAEIYFEYGWNDHSYNERDFIMSPVHSASFLAGAKKSIKLRNDIWLNFSGEIINMEQAPDYLVRDAGSWYFHSRGTGYSNYNQMLGAGMGFGSNLQLFSASLNDGYNKIGLLLERVQRDPNTHYTRWTDFSYGITGQYQFEKLLLSWRLTGVSSNNYGWKQDADRFNFLGMVGINYYW